MPPVKAGTTKKLVVEKQKGERGAMPTRVSSVP
jgi:hypothetical protein